MTAARFPERWLIDRRVMRLTGDDFRAFVLTTTWCVANRTDGKFEQGDVDMQPWLDGETIDSLCGAGLVTRHWDGMWELNDFLLTQTSAAVLAAAETNRAADAERKRLQRARTAAAKEHEVAS